MNAPSRLGAFLLVLVLAFGGAALLGAAIDPTDDEAALAEAGHADEEHEATQSAPAADSHGGDHAATPTDDLSGLAVSQDGFTLETDPTTFTGAGPRRFAFRIVDERGRILRDEFELESERELHLVVVRRDTATFEHVHPRKGQDGTWSINLNLAAPGVYRAFADFQIDGEKRVLATDLFVPGGFEPEPLPEAKPVDAIDGYSVALRLDRQPVAGQERTLSFSIRRDGGPVADVQTYLGARGHLVALREGDLGYLHTHPEAGDGGNIVSFDSTFPTAGRYRLFFQFRIRGQVRTVDYTVEVAR